MGIFVIIIHSGEVSLSSMVLEISLPLWGVVGPVMQRSANGAGAELAQGPGRACVSSSLQPCLPQTLPEFGPWVQLQAVVERVRV